MAVGDEVDQLFVVLMGMIVLCEYLCRLLRLKLTEPVHESFNNVAF